MELIKIENVEGKKTVSGRELWEFLKVGKDFSTWIKDKIEKRRFIEDEDFTTILGESTGGRPIKEYHLTLDMAKMISMLENNEKGDEVRRYFIECEKQANNQIQQLTAAEMMLQSAKLSRLEGVNIESVPDARFGRVNIYHTNILEEIVC